MSTSIEEARQKYVEEREKRLRSDGTAQYSALAGMYEEFNRDPYVEPGFTRDPEIADVDVVIVGGGFGGMLEAANLRKLGVDNFRIIEKGGDFGGTWYWNRYPGAMCDVESYVYLPMLEETGFMPTNRYALAPEIFAYCQQLGRRFDMYENALFQTEIKDMVWNEEAERWTVTTTRDDVLSTKFIVGSPQLVTMFFQQNSSLLPVAFCIKQSSQEFPVSRTTRESRSTQAAGITPTRAEDPVNSWTS